MKYFNLEPEVAGGVGKGTEMDRRFHPPIVRNLHYEFDVWLGDALLEGFPCFIATKPAADKIAATGLSGVSLGPVEVTTSGLFQDMYPNRKLPKFVWLKIDGAPGHDDFGVAEGFRITGSEKPLDSRRFGLVVSERALILLRGLGIEHALVSSFSQQF
jgi:hypothetical protein